MRLERVEDTMDSEATKLVTSLITPLSLAAVSNALKLAFAGDEGLNFTKTIKEWLEEAAEDTKKIGDWGKDFENTTDNFTTDLTAFRNSWSAIEKLPVVRVTDDINTWESLVRKINGLIWDDYICQEEMECRRERIISRAKDLHEQLGISIENLSKTWKSITSSFPDSEDKKGKSFLIKNSTWSKVEHALNEIDKSTWTALAFVRGKGHKAILVMPVQKGWAVAEFKSGRAVWKVSLRKSLHQAIGDMEGNIAKQQPQKRDTAIVVSIFKDSASDSSDSDSEVSFKRQSSSSDSDSFDRHYDLSTDSEAEKDLRTWDKTGALERILSSDGDSSTLSGPAEMPMTSTSPCAFCSLKAGSIRKREALPLDPAEEPDIKTEKPDDYEI
ncbi:Oidioi.mRNA.OKI2018_I69.YSR.g17071.t1.cds [Oikopleura dioica]|uniref:Oidioi.mRNA.OKI2018_I69.YSR.g17071.t1.cds n=1 Tax=Oikopleura dioica TaxID=34765 RepID=A0ABN7SMB3_OIKDI|nr:Oidioi.mRNA.OKI2018_I69.YSR.g17071.t1.cds [Oikopleura dioica]